MKDVISKGFQLPIATREIAAVNASVLPMYLSFYCIFCVRSKGVSQKVGDQQLTKEPRKLPGTEHFQSV